MEESTTKEKILKKVRNALISKPDNPFKDVDFNSPVYREIKETPDIEFALNLRQTGGQFIYCENEMAMVSNLKTLVKQKKWKQVYALDEKIITLFDQEKINGLSDPDRFGEAEASITRCDFLISRFGSVMVSSGLSTGRRIFAAHDSHIVLATASQIVPELKDALKGIKKKYQGNLPSQITLITGPSRTADIEKTLVMGAHGPKELYVFVVDDM